MGLLLPGTKIHIKRGCKKSADRIKPNIAKGFCRFNKPIEPLKIIKNLKLMKKYVLYYEQTSPLDVPLYAFGQTKSSLKP